MTKMRRASEGNTRLLSKYGAGSSPPRQSYSKGYATGGMVGGNPALEEGIEAAGGPAKSNLGKSGKKTKKKADKEAKTNVTVVVMPKGDAPTAAPPPGGPPMPMPMPMAGPPAGGPPMPPPDAGPMPMPPMRARGGRVMQAGSGSAKGRMQKAKDCC